MLFRSCRKGHGNNEWFMKANHQQQLTKWNIPSNLFTYNLRPISYTSMIILIVFWILRKISSAYIFGIDVMCTLLLLSALSSHNIIWNFHYRCNGFRFCCKKKCKNTAVSKKVSKNNFEFCSHILRCDDINFDIGNLNLLCVMSYSCSRAGRLVLFFSSL